MIAVITKVRIRIQRRFRLRAVEWEHAIMTTLWGGIVLYNPSLFDAPSFQAFSQIASSTVWGSAVLALGLLRLSALAINGFMPRPTALARSLSASIGILLFATLTMGFVFSGTGTTGLAVYPVVAVFGLFSLYWSVLDVALPDYHDAEPH